MQTYRHLWALVVLASVVATGCGGGGSSAPSDSAAVDPPPANGNYAGAYSCADTTSTILVFTTTLQSATGAFSSCSGSNPAGSITFSCTGSIASDGTFNLSGTDTHGNSLSFLGIATSTRVTGNYSITPANVSGSFQCNH